MEKFGALKLFSSSCVHISVMTEAISAFRPLTNSCNMAVISSAERGGDTSWSSEATKRFREVAGENRRPMFVRLCSTESIT